MLEPLYTSNKIPTRSLEKVLGTKYLLIRHKFLYKALPTLFNILHVMCFPRCTGGGFNGLARNNKVQRISFSSESQGRDYPGSVQERGRCSKGNYSQGHDSVIVHRCYSMFDIQFSLTFSSFICFLFPQGVVDCIQEINWAQASQNHILQVNMRKLF